MKSSAIRHRNHLETLERMEGLFARELNRLINRANRSSRSMVKAALREICDLKNSLKNDLTRSYQIDQHVRARREELICQRLTSGGHIL